MKRVWILAAKDLLETRRDRLVLLFTVIMPLAFTAFFGILFGSTSDRFPLAVNDADGGPAAQDLVALLEGSTVVKVTSVSAADAETAVDESRMTAALIIPAGFSSALAGGSQGELTLVGVSGSSGVQSVLTEVTAAAGRVAAAEAAARAATAVAVADPEEEAALGIARPVAADSLSVPAATVKLVAAGTVSGRVPTGFVLSSPGMLINFILFSMLTAGVALIQERRNFTLMRLMTTQLRRWELIAGKASGMFALTFVQQIILIGAGQLFFGVDYLSSPAALFLMMVALSLVASTLGLLLASLLTSEQALIASTVLVSMSVSALSGAWFPLEITGETFQSVGHLLPTTWILDGLRGIVLRGFGVAEVLPAFGVALLWAIGLFAIAVWRFRLAR